MVSPRPLSGTLPTAGVAATASPPCVATPWPESPWAAFGIRAPVLVAGQQTSPQQSSSQNAGSAWYAVGGRAGGSDTAPGMPGRPSQGLKAPIGASPWSHEAPPLLAASQTLPAQPQRWFEEASDDRSTAAAAAHTLPAQSKSWKGQPQPWSDLAVDVVAVAASAPGVQVQTSSPIGLSGPLVPPEPAAQRRSSSLRPPPAAAPCVREPPAALDDTILSSTLTRQSSGSPQGERILRRGHLRMTSYGGHEWGGRRPVSPSPWDATVASSSPQSSGLGVTPWNPWSRQPTLEALGAQGNRSSASPWDTPLA